MSSTLLFSGIRISGISLILILIFTFNNPKQVFAQTISYGDTVSVGSGLAFTWVETDAQNVPIRIGLSLTEAALTSPAGGLHSVDLPETASDSLFKHVLFAFEPSGHPPVGVYSFPHFDMHFYMISEAERITIPQGTDTMQVPEVFMPDRYILAMGNVSIYRMGVHYLDSLAGELHGQQFDKTLLYGFYKTKMLFVEPMITQAYLLTHPDTVLPISQPEEYQRTAYYPESYAIRYNTQNSLYEIFLTDFTLRSGVTSADNEPKPLSEKSYVLYQNYPNPFNPSTIIQFDVHSESFVKLEIFNLLGELVDVITNEIRPAGHYSLNWNPDVNLASGMYLYKITAFETTGNNTFSATKKMLLIR